MRKKGLVFEALEWIPRWVFAVIVIITFIAVTDAYIIRDLDVADVESALIAERLFIAESTLGAEEAGITRIGRVDQRKENRLNNPESFEPDLNRAVQFRRESHASAEVIFKEQKTWLQKEQLLNYLLFARRGLRGPGSAQVLDWSVFVVDSENKATVLNASVVIPNDQKRTI